MGWEVRGREEKRREEKRREERRREQYGVVISFDSEAYFTDNFSILWHSHPQTCGKFRLG
jgi:hypothetical protein